MLAAGIALALAASGCGDDTSGPAVDHDAPRLLTLSPADGATAVPVASVVRAAFSEPVVLDTLGPPPIRVTGPAGPLPGRIVADSTGTILTFEPADSLAQASDYRAVVAAGIADQAGNAAPDSTAVHFTTALEFYAIGRLITANTISWNLSVLDVLTYEPVPGSPVPLSGRPVRLAPVPEWGEVFVLYRSGLDSGVLVLDGRSLVVVRDTGPVFAGEATDLAVSAAESMLFVSVPSANALLVYDAHAMGELAAPIVFARASANPVRLAIAERFAWLLVGLDGGAELGAYALPSLSAVSGFPAPAVSRINTVAVDEARARAWVGGSERYAVVDLVNPARTVSFAWPTMHACLPPMCETRGRCFLLAPAYDRVYLLNVRDAIAAVGLSNLEVGTSLDERLSGFQADIALNPRSGELIAADTQSVSGCLRRLDPWTLRALSYEALPVGGGGVSDMAVLP